MFYEETIIEGWICYRTEPDGNWTPYPILELWERYRQGQKALAKIERARIRAKEIVESLEG